MVTDLFWEPDETFVPRNDTQSVDEAFEARSSISPPVVLTQSRWEEGEEEGTAGALLCTTLLVFSVSSICSHSVN